MADFAISAVSEDPLGLAGGVIVLVDVAGGPKKEFHESLNYNGVPISNAVKELKPLEEWGITYELQDAAALQLAFGVAVNTDYLITAASSSHSNDGRPTVSVTCIKPSAADKIKPYVGGAINKTFNGGFGVVDLHGAVVAGGDVISANWSVEMQTAEAMEPTSGDLLAGGLYQYSFKEQVQVTAYSTIAAPAGSHVTADDSNQARDGWKTFAKSYWKYLHSVALP